MNSGDAVDRNIQRNGWHFYSVLGGPTPGWLYTIGLSETYGHPELVIAGGTALPRSELESTLAAAVATIPGETSGRSMAEPRSDSIEFRSVDASWVEHLMLGAVQRYDRSDVPAVQIVIPGLSDMIDVPDLSVPFDTKIASPWRWLVEDWPFEIPSDTYAISDLDALRGHLVRQVLHQPAETPGPRWDAFASELNPVPNEIARAVPFGVLLGHDSSVASTLSLPPGGYAWRDAHDDKWSVGTQPT